MKIALDGIEAQSYVPGKITAVAVELDLEGGNGAQVLVDGETGTVSVWIMDKNGTVIEEKVWS